MVATGQNPSISVGKAPSNPPPVPRYNDKWVKRVYSSGPIGVAGTAASTVVSLATLFPGIPANTTVFFDKIQVWNTDRLLNCRAALSSNPITDLGLVESISVDDYGTASDLSGVTFVIPLGHAKQVIATSATTDILTLNDTPTPTFAGTYVVHSHVWVQI